MKERLGTMIALAATYHEGQFDKAGQPYILHCLKVLHYLDSEDEELQCIAVGHDLLEDTQCDTCALYEEGMTDRIVKAIDALTKIPGQTYEDYKQAVFANEDAMRVKLADLKHNSDIRRMKDATQKDFDRVARYMAFYKEIQERLN